ncbi:MAG: anthranilate phosphoribosyltransferase [Gemmatimonadales bacterium]
MPDAPHPQPPRPATPSPLLEAIAALANRRSLSETHATDVFGAVMRGDATAAQIAALLMGLRVKGETAEEIAGAARALRAVMVRVEARGDHLVDTCGTGGGSVSTFNISTAAAFVAAGAGAHVAKHGNRSFTSKCGSADVLEALGVRIALDAAQAARVLSEACVTFLFAPSFHPAMKHAGPIRRELAVPSIMNLLGPLANPAGVRRQVIGVADPDRAPLVAEALARLGAEHALVVHGRIGMDEISPQGMTDVWEVRTGRVTAWELDPARYDLALEDAGALAGGEPAANAARMERLLAGGRSDALGLAAVVLNGGAAVYAAGLASSYDEGVRRARDVLESGAAYEALERLRRATASASTCG